MNIFILSEIPAKAAIYHCDKHVVKMILESTQMLSAAAIANQAPEDILPKTKLGKPYRATHSNHPCTLWAGRTRKNYLWLYELFTNLCIEYQNRYKKIHSCQSNIVAAYNCSKYIPAGDLQPFPIAISEDSLCRNLPNFENMSTVEKYRAYYSIDKAPIARWKLEVPHWYNPQTQTQL